MFLRMPPPAFTPIPNRDAAAVIRGFVYQIETTVLRWLDLQDGEALELERGEDIDRISEVVEADGVGVEAARVLEQVKREAAPLTLRSGGARAALAHLHAYRAAHPQLHLSLRYTTTAAVGMERDGGGLDAPAIEVWRAICGGALPESEMPAAVAGLRCVLQGGRPPAGVSAAHWDEFQRFVANADDDPFRAFVLAVEWSTHSADESQAAAAIHARLQATGMARDLDEAEALRERLVVHVWGVLTATGLKRLAPDDLRRVLARPTLGARERARLDGLYVLLGQLSGRVETLERDVTSLTNTQRVQSALIAQSTAHLDRLTREAGIRADVAAVLVAPSLEPPAVVSPGALRPATVDRLLAALETARWLALYGASGTGKSQLALRTAARLTESPTWVSFRGLTTYQAALRLDAALGRLAGRPPSGPTSRADLERLIRALGSKACVVLDDVPRFTADDEFGTRVLTLAAACAAAGVRLLSTGIHQPASSVAQRLPDGALAVVPTPAFMPAEVGELLESYGAAGAILEPAALTLAAALRHGHPVLLQVFARRMAVRGWPDTLAAALAALVEWQSDQSVNEETLQRVLETVEDPTSRQLLARLTFVVGEFGLEEAQTLAAVHPPVDQPRARLHRITGLWVQAEAGEQYSLSPLVRELGPVDVAPATAVQCHLALARRLVGRPTIDQLDVLRAFSHFNQGGEPRSAALLLLRALAVAIRGPARGPAPLFLSLWIDTPPPYGLGAELAMYVRAAQIRACNVWGVPSAALAADLDRRLDLARNDDDWAVFAAAAFMLGGELTPEYVQRSVRWLHLLLTTWPAVAHLWSAHGLPEPSADLGLLVWHAIPEAWGAAGLREWLGLMEAVPSELRAAVFGADIAYTGSDIAAGALVAFHERLPPADRRWEEALDALADMEHVADRLGAEVLWAAACSARLLVLGRHQGDLRAAEREAQEARQRAPSTESRFLIAKTMGLLYVDARDLASAEPWLTTAVACRSTKFRRVSVITTLWASVAVGRHDRSAAAALAADAVERARAAYGADEIALVDTLSEAGLALFLAGDGLGGLALWHDAGRRIYARAEHDVDAAGRLTVLLNPLAYYSHITRRGAESAVDGTAPPAPERGAGFRARRSADAPAPTSTRLGFAVLMSEVAQGLGKDTVAAEWASSGLDLARRDGAMATVALLASVQIPNALEAREEALALCELLVAGRALTGYEAASQPAAFAGDCHAAVYGLLPMALRLGTLILEASPDAPRAAERIVAACRAVAVVSDDPVAWDHAARVVERGFVERASARELFAMTEQDASTDSQLTAAIRSVAYLAASLDPALQPADALRGHLAVMPWIEPILATVPRVYRATLTPFLLAYWRRAIERTGFRFSAPRAVAQVLADLRLTPPAEATRPLVRRLMRAVTASLGVCGGPAAVRWLAQLGADSP